ncbi:hypothetical protein J5Y09_07795 [Roseomonas sp. PWR1]|uniref:Uncharacterized protein n=1 Tax=Roseomonas nitratireducens TaxID=2820810 RepID=A0ABS4AR14_9PROT|nr:hypothetical protein [Neoroseomonas nitratireducens]MBP0463809.1 hypothetical protein [Neoroseomonas nitratireducens]
MTRGTVFQASLLAITLAGGAAMAADAPGRRDMADAYARALGLDIGGQAEALDIVAAAVPEEELGDMRGGFALPGGLSVAFGFDIETRLGGQVVQRLTLPASVLGPGGRMEAIRIVEGSATRLADPAAGPAVAEGVFNGGATRIVTQAGIGTVLGVVQNSRDGQVVQQRSNLQVDISGMGRLLDATSNRRVMDQALPRRGGWAR